MTKWVYSFGAERAEGRGEMKNLLGGKGANLHEMAHLGLPVVDRSPYDAFMLRFHHYMKADAAFQRDCPKDRWEFPPHSAWVVFTDTTSHACLSGQYALEQTFIVRRASLLHPEKAPIAILGNIAGVPLAAMTA